MDIITKLLEDAMIDGNLSAVVRHAAARGFTIINKYYSKTDESIMCHAAMSEYCISLMIYHSFYSIVMHPKYKCQYFKDQHWPEEWINTAKALMREHYNKFYADTRTTPSATPASAASSSSQADDDDPFSQLDEDNGSPGDANALELWMDSAKERGNTDDPIVFWLMRSSPGKGKGVLSDPLARMAIDLLTTPGKVFSLLSDVIIISSLHLAASTDIERGFTRGGLMVSDRRHNLSAKSVRAGTVVSSWLNVPGLVDPKPIINHFNEKSKRVGKGKAKSTEQDVIQID
jgi:hypothetical protein